MVFLFIVLTYSNLASMEPVVEFTFLIDQNDTIILDGARAYFGEIDQRTAEPSDYILQIHGVGRNLLAEVSLPVYFVIADPLEEVSETYTSLELPYSQHYRTVSVLRNQQKLLEEDLSFLCMQDTICQQGENSASCVEDCPFGGADALCDRKEDDRCDLDCLAGDIDCSYSKATLFFVKKPSLGIGIFVLLAVLLVFYWYRKKK